MLTEARRRKVLTAMQVDCWMPRARLPFAAAPRAHMLQASRRPAAPAESRKPPQAAPIAPKDRANRAGNVRSQLAVIPPKPAQKRPSAPIKNASPRFSLQLLRAGNCLFLMDCPYGEFLQSREPAYLLLADILRAAHLPPSPKPLGEPVTWPLLANRAVEQDSEAARDYLHAFMQKQLEAQPCTSLWLFGADALRFTADGETRVFHPLSIEGLCSAWVLPALDELLASPPLKRELWQSMQRIMTRWNNND